MRNKDLADYFHINHILMQENTINDKKTITYSLTEIDNMIPWELDVYIGLLLNSLKEQVK